MVNKEFIKQFSDKYKDVKIVAVTKYVDHFGVQLFKESGMKHIGENRVDSFLDKFEKVDEVIWHFIGSLQTKKVKKEVREVPQEPLNLAVRLDANMNVLEDLYRLIRQNPGNRQLKITIISKLQNVVIDSAIRVDSKIITALDGNEAIDIIG